MRHLRPWPPSPPSPAELDDAGHGYDVFGYDPRARRWALDHLRWISDHYFRVRSSGADQIPRSGPAILVANHGGALPIDAALISADVDRAVGRVVRPIADRFIPSLPLISTWFARIGAVVGTHANVARLLERGALIAIFPEGAQGIAKPARERYQLKEWRVGHAELALRHRAPVLPVAVLGAEEAWPVLGRITRLQRFGIPFLPVPAVPVPLPLRHVIFYGAPIALHAGLPDDAADQPALVAQAAARVRAALAHLLDDARAARAGRFA
jgi:1-acyl-sn-glycerol-3-phosphate acyltransferase